MSSSEAVPRLIRQIYRVRPDLKLPETAIHMILFEVRAALPGGNPERRHLPFYWYEHGPYSEVVKSSIDALKRRGILCDEETEAGKTLLVLNARFAAVGCVCEDDTSAIVGRIVREIDPCRIETFVNRIYRDHAPYEFMPRYRVDFLAPFKDCLASHPEGRRTPFFGPAIGRLEDALYECEAALVGEPLFEGFNDEFSAYVSGAGKAFDVARTDESTAYPVMRATYAIARDIWCAFAGGVRILKCGHDDYYDGRLRQWGQEYRETFSALVPKVHAYNRYVREFARCIPPVEPDERTTRILSSLIEGYLSG